MNAPAPIRLYGYFNSSAAYRVRIALALKGLPWEAAAVNLRAGEQLGAEFGAVNPAHLVPALEHAGRVITQSLAIIDYLDSLQAQPRLIPTDAPARTRALEIVGLIGCDIHPLDNLRVLEYLRAEIGCAEPQVRAWYAHWVRRGFDALEAMLPPQAAGFCVEGATDAPGPTIADCFLVPQVANAERFGVDMTAWPRITQAANFCRALPAFQRAAPRNQDDFLATPAVRG